MSDLINAARQIVDALHNIGMPNTIEMIEKLVNEIERLNDEFINLEALAKDRYCRMQTEIERLNAEVRELRIDRRQALDEWKAWMIAVENRDLSRPNNDDWNRWHTLSALDSQCDEAKHCTDEPE